MSCIVTSAIGSPRNRAGRVETRNVRFTTRGGRKRQGDLRLLLTAPGLEMLTTVRRNAQWRIADRSRNPAGLGGAQTAQRLARGAPKKVGDTAAGEHRGLPVGFVHPPSPSTSRMMSGAFS